MGNAFLLDGRRPFSFSGKKMGVASRGMYAAEHFAPVRKRRAVSRERQLFSFLVQNKHSTRSGYEASEAMLIFVIMGGQWMDGFFGEPSVRAVNSPPPSCCKDSIEQVAPAMPRARHEPN